MQNEKLLNKIILLTGGGTGGSVSPLLAIVDELKSYKVHKAESNKIFEFLWLGTKKGPEREMVEKENIKFEVICYGKLRRYFSLKNFIDPFLIILGFFQACFIILKTRPSLVMSAGSFVSVPIIWAAWLLGVPILIHQQDVRPGLANKLMAPFANIITVAFKESLNYFGKKAIWTGNPIRLSIVDPCFAGGFDEASCRLSIEEIFDKFNLKKNLPVVLIVGGGTGAMAINKLVWESIEELTKFCQVVHITGKDKNQKSKIKNQNYKCFEFLEADKMAEALRIADVVVSRAGLGLLTEIFYLGKPAILIPIPDSHQVDNAKIFKEKQAAVMLEQKKLTDKEFVNKIRQLLGDEILRSKLRNNIEKVMKKGANKKVVEIVERITRDS